jgi:hypothetical protein
MSCHVHRHPAPNDLNGAPLCATDVFTFQFSGDWHALARHATDLGPNDHHSSNDPRKFPRLENADDLELRSAQPVAPPLIALALESIRRQERHQESTISDRQSGGVEKRQAGRQSTHRRAVWDE